jgi:hypothetical protein
MRIRSARPPVREQHGACARRDRPEMINPDVDLPLDDRS